MTPSSVAGTVAVPGTVVGNIAISEMLLWL